MRVYLYNNQRQEWCSLANDTERRDSSTREAKELLPLLLVNKGQLIPDIKFKAAFCNDANESE